MTVPAIPQPTSEAELLKKAQELSAKEEAAKKIIAEVPKEINSVEEYTNAMVYLRRIKDRMTEVEDFRVSLTKPLNAALKALNDRFKKISEPLELARKELDKRCSKFRMEDAERTRKAQEEENKRATDAILQAAVEGRDVTDVAVPEVVQSLAQVAPNVGIGFQKVWRFHITNHPEINSEMDKWPRLSRDNPSVMCAGIPDKYWVLDFGAIGKDIRSGMEVPGFSAKQEEISKVK